jgi:hypothetical protein
MTSIPFILAAILIAAFVITFVVPGGIFVVPVLLAVAAIWGLVRRIGSRRDSTAAGPR